VVLEGGAVSYVRGNSVHDVRVIKNERCNDCRTAKCKDRIFVELMTSDRTPEASRECSK